jgi:hypothetical protein
MLHVLVAIYFEFGKPLQKNVTKSQPGNDAENREISHL